MPKIQWSGGSGKGRSVTIPRHYADKNHWNPKDNSTTNFDAGIVILNQTETGRMHLAKIAPESRREMDRKQFLEDYGFKESDPPEKSIEYVTRDEYDQLIDTSTLAGTTPEERGHTAAMRILNFEMRC